MSQPSARSKLQVRWSELPAAVGYQIYSAVMNAIDFTIADRLQRLLGQTNRMAYLFMLPNMLVFSIFVLFPMILNFYYAFTGGTQLFPQNRPFVGLANFQQLFTCGNFLNPNPCSEDRCWHGLYNKFGFVALRGIGVPVISLLTAIILNGNIVGGAFFRRSCSSQARLSPRLL